MQKELLFLRQYLKDIKKIKAIAVVGDSEFTYPCGVCRQVIREFGKDATIIIANSEENFKEYALDDLLPPIVLDQRT